MKVVIVGAGSVGQVYAYALQHGGADVSLFVKDKYRASLAQGFDLYALNLGREPLHVTIPSILSSVNEVRAEVWDAVILCIPTNGIRSPDFPALLQATGNATVLSMIPGENVEQEITRFIPNDRFLNGIIGIISYPAPLPGESLVKPGTAFWNAPFASSVISGSKDRALPLVKIFKKGGLPFQFKDRKDLDPFGEPLLRVFIASLRRSGWTFASFLQKDEQRIFRAALDEAMTVVEKRNGKKRLFFLKWNLTPLFRLLQMCSRLLAPFDMETYLRVHFTKVGIQMQEGVHFLIKEAGQLALPSDNLRLLSTS